MPSLTINRCDHYVENKRHTCLKTKFQKCTHLVIIALEEIINLPQQPGSAVEGKELCLLGGHRGA